MSDDVDFTDGEGSEVRSHALIKEVFSCRVPQTHKSVGEHLLREQVLRQSGTAFITN